MQARQLESGLIPKATPVSRKLTSIGGFEVDTNGMPEKQSGRTSAGSVVPELAEDAEGEASATVLALITRLAEVAQDLRDKRFIQAAESLKSALRQTGEARQYAEHLALNQRVQFKCPRCQVADTHDIEGRCFCDACVSATYGKVKL